jgi:Zn-dependent protease
MRNLYYLRTIRGRPVRLHYTWIIAVLLGISALISVILPDALPGQSRWIYIGSTLLIGVFFCIAVLVHECAHLLVASIARVRLSVLNLYPLGALTRMPNRFRSGWADFWIAAAGPASSIVLWWLLSAFAGTMTPGWLATTILITARLSLYLGLINLLPGLPLDGGRMLHRFIYEFYGSFEATTRITQLFGQIIAYSLMLFGINELIQGQSWAFAIAFILIGWSLREAGGTAHRRELVTRVLQHLTAADINTAPRQTASPEQTLRQFAISLRGRFGKETTPVVANGAFLGMIDRQLIREVPQGYWDERTVAETMQPLNSLDVLAPATPVSEIIPRLTNNLTEDLDTVFPVVNDGHLLGLINAEELLSILDLEDEFGLFEHGLPAPSVRAYSSNPDGRARQSVAQRPS